MHVWWWWSFIKGEVTFSLRKLYFYVYKNVMPFHPIKHYRVAAQVHCIVASWVYSHCDKAICLFIEVFITHVSISVISLSIGNFLVTPLLLVISL